MNYGSQEEYNAAMSAQGYAEAEAGAAAAQAQAEQDEQIRLQLEKLADDYIQSLSEDIWLNPTITDVSKAFIAGMVFAKTHKQFTNSNAGNQTS